MPIKRQIFYSFHYDNDVFRVQQIRNMGAFEENKPVTANAWEEVKKGGDVAIKKWIDDNMNGRSCIVVLIGQDTSNRPWVRYEIKKAWEDGKGLLGIHINNLKCPVRAKENPNSEGKCSIGINPFTTFNIGNTAMSSIVKCYNPSSDNAYRDIKDNIDKWVEEAIKLRADFK